METKGFISYLEGKNHSKRTQQGYLHYVKRFFLWVKMDAEQVTKPDILRYLEYLQNQAGIQNATRQIHLFALNHYFTHLYNQRQIDKNPCLFIKLRGTKVKKTA